MAMQARARHYVPPTSLSPEVIETKASRPVSQSWSSMRRSAVSIALQLFKKQTETMPSLCFHNSEKVHRPRDRLFSPPLNPPTSLLEDLLSLVIALLPIWSRSPHSGRIFYFSVRICENDGRFLSTVARVCDVLRDVPEGLGPASWTQPAASSPLMDLRSLSCAHWCMDFSGCIEWALSDHCHLSELHSRERAPACRDTNHFVLLPAVRGIYGVITELHNESGSLFKF